MSGQLVQHRNGRDFTVLRPTCLKKSDFTDVAREN